MTTERVDVVFTERGARMVRRRIDGIGSGAATAQGSVQLLRRSLGALGGALILRGAVRTLANFGQEMSTVRAVTGATEEQFRQLTDSAKDLGATTRFTATQAAEGMTFLARAGFETTEVLESVGDVLVLAQAGALDLGRAADIASNVLKGFNLEAAQTTRIVDVLAKTAASSNTTVEQLGDAMSFVAPAAAAVGVSVEAAASAIGVLSDAGIQATRAGTGLRQIFVQLLSPTGAAQAELRGLGLSLADVDIQTRGLVPVLETLRDKQIGLSEAANLVGVRQASSLLVLTKNIPRLKELSNANAAAAGTAREMAAVMDDNLNGALLRVRSAAESVVLALGAAGGEGGIRGILERLAPLLRLVAANADLLAKALAAMGAVILGRLVLGAITLLVTSLKSLSLALVGIAIRVLPLLAGAAVAAFTILAAVAATQGKSIEETFNDLKESVVDLFKSTITEPIGVINAFDERIGGFVETIQKAGGFASLSKTQIEGLSTGINELRDEVNQRLLLQQFLAPGSESVKQLTAQIDVLDRALAKLRGDGDAQIPTATTTPEAVVAQGGSRTSSQFKDFIRDLERESTLLKLSNEQRTIQEALFRAEDSAKRALTEAETNLVKNLVAGNIALDRQSNLLESIQSPARQYQTTLQDLNDLLERGAISSEEFATAQRDIRMEFLAGQTDIASGIERTFLGIQAAAEDSATQISSLLTGAFQDAEDAFVDFVQGGKLSFKDLVDNIEEQLLRLAFQNVTGQLGAGLGFGSSPAGGGLLGGLFGGGGGGGGGLGGLLSFLPGFAHGGEMVVGPGTSPSIGGVDNRLVALRARDGERIRITPPGQSGERAVNINFNITTPNVDSFDQNKGRIFADASLALQRANRRDN